MTFTEHIFAFEDVDGDIINICPIGGMLLMLV